MMSQTVFLAVLGAALLHATWNALIKGGARGSQVSGILVMTIVQGLLGAAIVAFLPWPDAVVWLWLLASGVFHAGYKLFLAYAYEQGDLSRVYPIARGAAPLIVTGLGALLLSDRIQGVEYAGIFVLGAGIALMARGAFTSGESRRLVPLALASAVMTAGYSLVDGMGARVAGDALLYVAWLFVLDMVIFLPICLGLRGRDVVPRAPRDWWRGAGAAVASFAAYGIAVWAMTEAPIALVTALRETSILFAVLIGWLVFGDRMDRGKVLAAVLIVGGVVLTRV